MCIILYSLTHTLVCADPANREAADEAKELKEKVKLLQESLEEERAEKVRHCIQPVHDSQWYRPFLVN